MDHSGSDRPGMEEQPSPVVPVTAVNAPIAPIPLSPQIQVVSPEGELPPTSISGFSLRTPIVRIPLAQDVDSPSDLAGPSAARDQSVESIDTEQALLEAQEIQRTQASAVRPGIDLAFECMLQKTAVRPDITPIVGPVYHEWNMTMETERTTSRSNLRSDDTIYCSRFTEMEAEDQFTRPETEETMSVASSTETVTRSTPPRKRRPKWPGVVGLLTLPLTQNRDLPLMERVIGSWTKGLP